MIGTAKAPRCFVGLGNQSPVKHLSQKIAWSDHKKYLAKRPDVAIFHPLNRDLDCSPKQATFRSTDIENLTTLDSIANYILKSKKKGVK
jgi:hypothetical protein